MSNYFIWYDNQGLSVEKCWKLSKGYDLSLMLLIRNQTTWSYCTKCGACMQDIILATHTHSKRIQFGCFKLWFSLYPSSISWMDMNGSMFRLGTKCTCYVQLDFNNKVCLHILSGQKKKSSPGIRTKQLCSLKKTTYNWGKKGFSLVGSIKIVLWSDGKGSYGLMSPDLPCSSVMGTWH